MVAAPIFALVRHALIWFSPCGCPQSGACADAREPVRCNAGAVRWRIYEDVLAGCGPEPDVVSYLIKLRCTQMSFLNCTGGKYMF